MAQSKHCAQFLEVEDFNGVLAVFSILNGKFLATKEEETCFSHMYSQSYILDLSVQVDGVY